MYDVSKRLVNKLETNLVFDTTFLNVTEPFLTEGGDPRVGLSANMEATAVMSWQLF
jgi:hypothetical protein